MQKEKLDKVIEDLSQYIIDMTKSKQNCASDIAACTSALAELLLARANRI